MDDQYEELLRGYNYERKVKNALRNALKECIERLEASMPPKGGRTAKVIGEAKAILANDEARRVPGPTPQGSDKFDGEFGRFE